MSRRLQPPPMREPFMLRDRPSPAWLRWLHQIEEHLSGVGVIAWAAIDKAGSSLADLTTRLFTDLQFTGSNLTSIATRRHRDLQDLQGGTTAEYYHMTSAQHTEVTGFFAATDITGAEAETLTAGSTSNADGLHDHTDYANEILLTADDELVTDGSGNIVIGNP